MFVLLIKTEPNLLYFVKQSARGVLFLFLPKGGKKSQKCSDNLLEMYNFAEKKINSKF